VSSVFTRAIRALGLAAAEPAKRPRGLNAGEVASGFEASGGIPDIDYLDDLGWPNYLPEFRKVVNDPQIAKELRAATYPLLRADWSVEPASDDDRDQLIAEFIGANRYQLPSDTFGRDFWMATPWPSRLRDISRFLQFGFAMFHRTYRQQGRFIIIDKMKWIVPESIEKWDFGPADEFLGVYRTFIGADGVAHSLEYVPAEELVVYTWDQEGSNILGRPLIRAMWKPYQFKARFEKMAIINKQKTAIGIPYVLTREGDSPDDETRAASFAKAMRAGNHERLYFKGKVGQEFGWKEGGDSNKGFPELINGANTEIAKAGGGGLVQELGIGDASGGSRGVAGAQALAGVALPEAIATFVILVENAEICLEVDLNFPPGTPAPTCKVAGIDPFERTRNMPEVVNAASAGVITKTLDTENEVRRAYGLMEIDEAERDAAIAANRPPMGTPGGPADPNAAGGPDTAPPGTDAGDAAAAPDPGSDAPSAPTGTARRPGPRRITAAATPDPAVAPAVDPSPSADAVARAKVDLDRIQRELERWEATYLGSLNLVQRDMREAVVEQIRAGRAPKKPDDLKVPFQEDLKDRLISILKSVRDFGREQLTAEVNRQLQTLASAARPDPSTRRGAITYSNNQAEVIAQLDVSNLVQRLQTQAVAQYNQLAGTGATPAEIAGGLEDYFSSLTDAQIDNMARASTSQSFNAGRNVAILELKPQLGPMAVRVEVLDENTCEPCAALDGQEFQIGSDAYLENQPPLKCEGGQRCRGFYVVEAMP
jgi:hypothetical protein